MRDILWIAVVLACPLMMILMMRFGHGHGHGHAHGHGDARPDKPSLAELRRRRDELDAQIAKRETAPDEASPSYDTLVGYMEETP